MLLFYMWGTWEWGEKGDVSMHEKGLHVYIMK